MEIARFSAAFAAALREESASTSAFTLSAISDSAGI